MNLFWSDYIDRLFVSQMRAFRDAILDRVGPSFCGIEEEADRIAQERFDSLMSSDNYNPNNIDPDTLAEQALDEGESFLAVIDGVRKGILALSAVGLWHLLEQQLLLFHRKHLLEPSKEDCPDLLNLETVERRLANVGIATRALPSWPRVYELRLLANTIKHGDGKSAAKLKELRPDLFLDAKGECFPNCRQVLLPLAGEDVFVTEERIAEYADAAITFLEELAKSLRRA